MQAQKLIFNPEGHPAIQGASQTAINMYRIASPLMKNEQMWSDTPGWTKYASLGKGEIRGGSRFSKYGNSVIVSGNAVFTVGIGGALAQIGSLDTEVGHVSVAENGIEVMLADGNAMWRYDGTSFAKVTMPFTKPPTRVIFHEGFFISFEPDTGNFYISDTFDGLTWNALQFANAQEKPDLLKEIASDRVLWLFGESTAQAYDNTSATFPFTPNYQGRMLYGIRGRTQAQLGNTTYFLGTSANGGIGVWRSKGYVPEPVSTPGFETLWSSFDDLDEAYAMAVSYERREWYVITFPRTRRTFVLDIETGWFEWTVFDTSDSSFDRHPATMFIYFDDKNIFGDRNGDLWYLDGTTTKQGDALQVREFTTQVFHDTNERIGIARLWIDMQVGDHDPTVTPNIMLQVSRDGGKSFGNWLQRDLGESGEYERRAWWARLGSGFNMVFKVRVMDDYRWRVFGGGLE